MRARLLVSYVLVALAACMLIGASGCVRMLLTELVHDHSELAEPLLILSVDSERKVGAGVFRILHPGFYTVYLNTTLKDETVERYELPRFEGSLAGRVRISSSGNEYVDHFFDVSMKSTTIGRSLFQFRTRGLIPWQDVLPQDELLTFQVEISRIDPPLADHYRTIVFSIRRRGTLID